MLSKEKIHHFAIQHTNRTDPNRILSFEGYSANADFIAGATWASEQYAGVVNALEKLRDGVLLGRPVGEMNYLTKEATSELNKLKQP